MQTPLPTHPLHSEMTTWRQHLHSIPELAYQEKKTSDFIANKLQSFGIPVTRGLGGTGVVGTLSNGTSTKNIGLRADMDAIPLTETNTIDYKSQHQGIMHGCGHDGHMAMLLGAARYLADTLLFDGTVQFIFQPAEENSGGANAMIQDGIFDKFAIDQIYALHNMPDLPAGEFATTVGPIMASNNRFEITINGRSTHAAKPHCGIDPFPTAATLIQGIHSIIGRNLDPAKTGVISLCQIESGQSWNVIPEKITMRGTIRALDPETQNLLKQRLEDLVTNSGTGWGTNAELNWVSGYPLTINPPGGVSIATRAAKAVAGDNAVREDAIPSTGAEDFSFFLQQRPGCYLFLGSRNHDSAVPLHNSQYDFNDDILSRGMLFWVELVQQELIKPT